jgi:hypothetical protein
MTSIRAGFSRFRQLGARQVLVVAALTLAILVAGTLAIRAQESPPVSGCFGGLLDRYPVHCAALEGMHNQGIIRIEAIYEGGKALFVFVDHSGPITQSTLNHVKGRAWRELLVAGWGDCDSDLYQDFGCEFGVLKGYGGHRLLPPMAEWDDIVLVAGGEAAPRSETGWAAMSKRWPATAQGATGAGSAAATWDGGAFDISDVNLADDLNAVDCAQVRYTDSCDSWERHPDLGIAGVFYYDGDPKTYFQIKAPTGADDPKIATARTAIVASRYGITEADFIAIPVKYDYADLWRWGQILDRLALSAGNTIGLTGARVDDNIGFFASRAVYPTSDVIEFRHESPALFRSTLLVGTLNMDMTLAALPQLLGQLGIPVEAVGIVVESNFKSLGIPRAH